MSRATGIDWPALMRAGLRGLRLRPWEFWALTPVELELMLGDARGISPLGRDRLRELMDDYPDQGEGMTDGRV